MSLIPIDITHIHPVVPYNSADAPVFVAGSDSQDYVAKLPSADNPYLSAAESLAYYLCGRLGLAVPAWAYLKFPDGRIGFGSRVEPGVSQFTQLAVDERMAVLLACRQQIVAFCLLDAFLSNPDRHLDNMLFRRSPIDGRWTVVCMDFSRALWRGGFPASAARDTFERGKTAATVTLLQQLDPFETKIAVPIVAALQGISPKQIAAHVDDMPPSMACDEARRLPEWWASQARLDRAASLLDLLK